MTAQGAGAPADTEPPGLERIARDVRGGRATAVEIAEAALERLARNGLNALRSQARERALRDAAEVDRVLAGGEDPGPLAGVPFLAKDNIAVAGVPLTAGSPLHGAPVPAEDAEVVARLRAAGAVIVGKAHMSEWALGATNHNEHFGPARNAWDPERITGGSSGGSGTAVAAGLAPLALGTDTGGSVRIPAALCGVTGLRPTHGRVSIRGVVPTAVSFDTVGPLARRAQDVALALSVMAGHDPQDPTSADHPADDLRADGGAAPLRIGFLRSWTEASAAPTVAALVAAALDELAAAGADVVELDVDGVGAASGMFADLVLAEAAAVHAQRLAETPDGFAPDARSRLEHGAAVTGPAYAEARHRARGWTSRVREAMRDVDLLACPTTPVVAPRIDEIDQLEGTVLMGRFTVAWVLTGQPSASVPCGFDGGLPAGLQLIGRPWEEATVLRAAAAYQTRTGWHLACPPEPAGDE